MPEDPAKLRRQQHSDPIDQSLRVIQGRPRLSFGSPAMDRVFGGGLLRDSLSLVTGSPGAGKTIMAQQIAFATAQAGMHVIYFTNVSEPHAKLVEHMRNFTFYEPDQIGERIRIYNITSQIRNKGFKETLDFVVETVRSERADLVIIDSFRGLKHVLDVNVRDRASIFDLAAQLSILGCTSILVGEYTQLEMQTEPEFAIADGIIQLHHTMQGLQERRALRIVKMRGTGYLTGEHSFAITNRGIDIYPRQEALVQAPSYRASDERVSMGIDQLDTMTSGGVIRSSSTLIAGSAGVGKTILSLHFLAAGKQQSERGLLVSFQENPEQLAIRAGHFGLQERLGLLNGRTEVLFLSPVELDLDAAASHIREAVETNGVQRIVIDSVAELEFAAHDIARFDDFLASLVGFLRSHEVTTVMTREITQLFGNELSIASRGLSYIVDNILLLRYIELDTQIHRAIAVLKSRGSDHEKTLREFTIGTGAVTIGQPFDQLSGLMTGLPRSSRNQPLVAPPRTRKRRG